MRLLEAIRIGLRGAGGETLAGLSLKQGTVASVDPSGAPTVSLDDGAVAPASLAIDYPMAAGLRVYLLPSSGGPVVVGIVT